MPPGWRDQATGMVHRGRPPWRSFAGWTLSFLAAKIVRRGIRGTDTDPCMPSGGWLGSSKFGFDPI